MTRQVRQFIIFIASIATYLLSRELGLEVIEAILLQGIVTGVLLYLEQLLQ